MHASLAGEYYAGSYHTLSRRKCTSGKHVSGTAIRLSAALLAPLFLVTSLVARDSPQPRRPGAFAARGVYKAKVEPHWFANNTRFWYRNDLRGGAKEFVLVDAEAGTRKPA